MDLKKLQKDINILSNYNEKAHNIIKKLRELENLTDNENIILQAIATQNLTIMGMSSLLEEVSNTAVMANDIVENLSKTTGSGIDVFINEFSSRSQSVIDTKLSNIKEALNHFSTSVNENLEVIAKDSMKENSKIKQWVSKTISPISNYMKSSKLQSMLTTFIISILGGFVAIKLYLTFFI